MNKYLKKYAKKIKFLANEISRRDLNENIFYFHIPKCGGNSIDMEFSKYFKPTSIFKENSKAMNEAAKKYYIGTIENNKLEIENNIYLQKFKEAILIYNIFNNQYKYISGHFSYSPLLYDIIKNKYKMITILREPVKRYISEYFFNRYKKNKHFYIKEDLKEFIKTKRGEEYGCKYVKLLAGNEATSEINDQKNIDIAKNNLTKFDVVGVLEDLKGFEYKIEKKLGIKINVGHKNKNPVEKTDIKKQVSNNEYRIIEKLCEPDREIYEFVYKNK